MTMTILEGATFCICDDAGDVVEDGHGFFANDTRLLSRLRLTINRQPLLLLTAQRVEYFSAAFFLRNGDSQRLASDSLLVRRERFVGDDLHDNMVVTKLLPDPVEFELALELAADFADILSIKARVFAAGDPRDSLEVPEPRALERGADGLTFAIRDVDGLETHVHVSRRAALEDGVLRYRLRLDRHASWQVRLAVGQAGIPSSANEPYHFGEERRRVRASLSAWRLTVPRLRASVPGLQPLWQRSLHDLASLRMRASDDTNEWLPAAGMPWFMAVFGRDTIISSLQSLLLGPELAVAALRVLAGMQARYDDPGTDAEPGKIVHEVRSGRTATRWFSRYYGTIDATPLYLVLLSEVWRFTGDEALLHELWPTALRALEWIDRFGDRDGDGFIEYQRRTDHGLENQSWKDSRDSQRFADGRYAATPIAPIEAQAYVVAARRRCAELARVMGEEQRAVLLERAAETLVRRIDEAYWVEQRGGYYAMALDRDKQPVDSLCSNMGHLLLADAVLPQRLDQLSHQLTSDELFSGWGIRTMSKREAAYNPIAYHNGTVWPHDNALIAWGLARAGRHEEASLITHRLLLAAEQLDFALPELFSGIDVDEAPFPVAYPTAARPQAWAASAPLLLLRSVLALEPDPGSGCLVSDAPDPLPAWLGDLRIDGVRALGHTWSVVVEDGHCVVTRSSDDAPAGIA